MESEHAQCLATRDELRGQLASHRVINKEDYLKQLDLVTYEGRAAANSLLKRLGKQVQFKRDNPSRFQVLDENAQSDIS